MQKLFVMSSDFPHIDFVKACRSLSIVACLCVGGTSSGEFCIQTDWSGGPGVPGPVGSWGSDFSSFTGITWQEPGVIYALPTEYLFASGIDNPCCAFAADLDGDGDEDVVTVAADDHIIQWYENDYGAGTAWTTHGFPAPYGAYRAWGEDFNEDGKTDVACFDTFNDNVGWWENIDAASDQWYFHQIGYMTNTVLYGAACDLDSDGDCDLVITEDLGSYDRITWCENLNGIGTYWGTHTIEGNAGYIIALDVGDIDGDDDLDVVCSLWEGVTSWWENSATWPSHVIRPFFPQIWADELSDVDGDGDLDLFLVEEGGTSAYDISWMENLTGEGSSWQRHQVCDGSFRFGVLLAHDFDEDGDPDLAAGGDFPVYGMHMFENVSAGVSWIQRVVSTTTENASSAASCDLNGDGHDDLLVADHWADRLCWWNLSSPQGSLTSSILDTYTFPDWSQFAWESSSVGASWIGFQVRSLDEGLAGNWSDTLFTSPVSLSGIVEDGDPHFQYRVLMGGSFCTVYSVSLGWNEESTPDSTPPRPVLLVRPNPCSGSPVISVALGVQSTVSLLVFDVTGRLVEEVYGGVLEQGISDFQAGQLPAGLYIAFLSHDGTGETFHFLVL
jgi:hypothetical protein